MLISFFVIFDDSLMWAPVEIPVLFLLYRRFLYNKKRSARIALRRKRIVSLKRPAAGGESREAGFFFNFTAGKDGWKR